MEVMRLQRACKKPWKSDPAVSFNIRLTVLTTAIAMKKMFPKSWSQKTAVKVVKEAELSHLPRRTVCDRFFLWYPNHFFLSRSS